MLTTRVLPFGEWKRLLGTELAHLATLPADSSGIVVVVVEEEDGLGPAEIVGCWATIQATHVEGLWHKPEVRGRADVGRALLGGMTAVLQQRGVAEVLTNALEPGVEKMLERMGGRPVPGQMWVFPVPGGAAVHEPAAPMEEIDEQCTMGGYCPTHRMSSPHTVTGMMLGTGIRKE